jgi:hypothetical protein
MAIFGAVFAALGRFLGRIVQMALGWASTLLFGQIPENKQLLLSFVTLGSIAWVVVLLGVLIPDIGAFLLTAAPIPDFIEESWIRIAMLVAAIVLPILIGIGGLMLIAAERRPKGKEMVVQILRGYPYAVLLAFTLVFLGVVALIRRGRSMIKRWQDAHIAIVIKPGGYEKVATDLEAALDNAGLDFRRTPAPRVLEAPSKLLAKVGGSGVAALVPDRLIQMVASDLEVLVYPSDIFIAGKEEPLARARAAIASRLTFTAAYLTSSEDAQRIEERLERIANGDAPLAARHTELKAIDKELASVVLRHEEWEVLYRMRQQVERNLLAQEREDRVAEVPGRQEVATLSPPAVAVEAASMAAYGIAASVLDRVLRRVKRNHGEEMRERDDREAAAAGR